MSSPKRRRRRAAEVVGDLQRDPENRRVHSPRNIEMIARSLKQVGAARSIVIDERDTVLAGNGVLEAAGAAGITKLQVVEADGQTVIAVRRRGLTPAQKRELAIFDNRAGELASWDAGRLAADLAAGLELGTYFTDQELAALLGKPERVGKTDPDAVPALRTTSVKLGQRFALGAHRLLCGDATKASVVAKLADGAGFDLVVTSPPYNVGIKYNAHKDTAERDQYLGFIEGTARAFLPHLPGGRFVAWNIGVSPKTFPAHQVVRLEACGLTFYRQIVWKKSGVPYPVFPSTIRTKRARHYHPNYVHEVIELFETRGGRAVRTAPCGLCEGTGRMAARELLSGESHDVIALLSKGDPVLGGPIAPDPRYRDDVWAVPQSQATVDLKTLGPRRVGFTARGHQIKEHPAAFPVELPRALTGFLTASDERVYDPFGGSGSTLIACEQIGRRACLLELDPVYCQVIIDRWEAFTGEKATKI